MGHPLTVNIMRLTSSFAIVHKKKNADGSVSAFPFLTVHSAFAAADVHVDHQYDDVNLKVSSSLMR